MPPHKELKKTRVTGVTYYHRFLWSAAGRLIQEADELPEGKWYAYLSALVLSFFSFEGLLNYMGHELYPEVWEEERTFFVKNPYRGTAGKLEFLAEKLSVPIDDSCRPYRSFRYLLAFRNEVAHVRHETIDTEVLTNIEEIGRKTNIPAIVSPDSVHQIRADLEELGELLFRAAITRGLNVTGGSGALSGTVSSHLYHDIP